MTLRLPLANDALLAADRALGFNWNAYAHFLVDDPWRNAIFSTIYLRITFSGLMLTMVIALMCNNRIRVLEICFLMLTTAVTSVTLAAIFPAYPVFDSVTEPSLLAFMKDHNVYYLEQVSKHLKYLRDAPVAIIDPLHLDGIVCFPSFHTCMALIIIYCNRGILPFNILATVLGLSIIAGTPVYGGHYLVDVIGGAMITGLAAWLWTAKISINVSTTLPATSVEAFRAPNWLNRFKFAQET